MTLKDYELDIIRSALGREPSRAEFMIFEAEWSEHCSYKSSRRWLRELPTESSHVVRGPGLDAPLIKVGDVFVSFKIESHNHPSAVDPYDGAATGVGGIVRDILTTGLRPIALLNNLHFGNPSDNHSLWIARNVVRGISDYGNRIGVPVVGGEVWFDESFSRNPIVLVTCVGVGTEEQVVWGEAGPGDVVLVIGNDTGRDGMLGSAFASKTLGETDEISAVQVGNPLLEKLLIDAITELAQRRLVKVVKDVGGGGLAHRTPELMFEYAKTAVNRGLEVIIAGAGGAAHLPGMTASLTPLPVIGVPIMSRQLNGIDSLLSIVQMPYGTPVATVAINGARNAALLAARILGIKYPEFKQRVVELMDSMRSEVMRTVLEDA